MKGRFVLVLLAVLVLLSSTFVFAADPHKAKGASLDPALRNTTTDIPQMEFQVIDGRSQVTVEKMGAPKPPTALRAAPPTPLADWQLIQTVEGEVWVPKATTYSVYFDSATGSLAESLPPNTLTQKSKDAVAKAPTWMKGELADALGRLDSSLQNTLADLVLAATDPYVDEIAFTIAHLPPQTLTAANFNPALIVENAQGVYAVDPDIAYADIIDTGDSVTGGDYYSTVRYRVGPGGAQEYDYPKEMYYFNIVLPQITDEVPLYIDPTSDYCDQFAAPPTGVFWRTYLWTNTDDIGTHPILKDSLAGIDSLWNELQNTGGPANGAAGVVINWMNAVFQYTGGALPSCDPGNPSNTARPIQPISIYHRHVGRCGEHGDLTVAACRTALIPAVQSEAFLNDHCWTEIYERRWIQYEPENTMIDNFTSYNGWWPNGATVLWDWRGDGYMWTVTERYNPNFCTLVCNVIDAAGQPVDGARILLASQADGDPDPSHLYLGGWAYTDSHGQATFTLGASHNYYVRVDSVMGLDPTNPSQVYSVVTDAQAGTQYTWTSRNLMNAIPNFQASAGTLPGNPLEDYKLEITYTIPKEILYGTLISGDFREPVTGMIDAFICDGANFMSFLGGSPFSAFDINLSSVSGNSSFVIPTNENWYAVFTNLRNVVNTEVVNITANLYRNNAAPLPPASPIFLYKNGSDVILEWNDVSSTILSGYNVYRSSTAQDVSPTRTKPELDPFRLGAEPTTAVSDFTDTLAGSGPRDFYNVRTYGTDGSIASR
jgi:hypothetical protein